MTGIQDTSLQFIYFIQLKPILRYQLKTFQKELPLSTMKPVQFYLAHHEPVQHFYVSLFKNSVNI
jgi:hypothetical protein